MGREMHCCSSALLLAETFRGQVVLGVTELMLGSVTRGCEHEVREWKMGSQWKNSLMNQNAGHHHCCGGCHAFHPHPHAHWNSWVRCL